MTPKIMWQPTTQQRLNSQMTHYISFVNDLYDLHLTDYPGLYHWSIIEPEKFWDSFWRFANIIFSHEPSTILLPATSMKEAQWFLDSKLNFAENLLRQTNENIALIFNDEQNNRQTYTYQALTERVASLAYSAKQLGLQCGDRVAAILPNRPEAIISMLATTSLGAIWSSCSPEFGEECLFDRFHQIQPKILIACDGYFYNGKRFSIVDKVTLLREQIPSIERILWVPITDEKLPSQHKLLDSYLFHKNVPLEFEQLPFNHPVYILYSSGTTGVPKCIVHGAGGTLLQHLKELMLHTDVTAKDNIFYYTTCGWMMWNWYISSLALGATVLQYDGAALYPHANRLIDFIDEEQITIFGTSAKYISAIENENVVPNATNHLRSLRTILSTGSPLVAKNYEYVYQQIKSELCLSSISGGTDIISCFALGNPILPVYCGELQCIGLGMAVQIFNDQGKSVINQKGELVCTEPFPSMPICFWNDPGNIKYQHAYFDKFPDTWAHGDFAELTDRDTLIIYGRSDATLNPGGVRIGTAEIYRQVEKIPEIQEAIAVSQEWNNDSRIILFVVLNKHAELTDKLIATIKQELKEHCSPRHVPAKIYAVPDIPRTLSGKIVEVAVREIIHGRPVKNLSALANPECLVYYQNLVIT